MRTDDPALDRVPFFDRNRLLALEDHFGAGVVGADRAAEAHTAADAREQRRGFGGPWIVTSGATLTAFVGLVAPTAVA